MATVVPLVLHAAVGEPGPAVGARVARGVEAAHDEVADADVSARALPDGLDDSAVLVPHRLGSVGSLMPRPHRSEPHTQVAVSGAIASVFWMVGSGRSSTRTSPGPYMITPRMHRA